MNKVILKGNLGADPDLRYTQGGQAVMSMRLATTETYLDRNGAKQEHVEWHSLTLWGKRAEALHKYLSKGTAILIEGRLRTTSYENKEGQKVWTTKIDVLLVEFAGGRRSEEGESRPSGGAAPRATDRQPPDGGAEDFPIDDPSDFPF